MVTINFVNCTVSDVVLPILEDLDYKIGDSAVEVSFEEFQSLQADFCNY